MLLLIPRGWRAGQPSPCATMQVARSRLQATLPGAGGSRSQSIESIRLRSPLRSPLSPGRPRCILHAIGQEHQKGLPCGGGQWSCHILLVPCRLLSPRTRNAPNNRERNKYEYDVGNRSRCHRRPSIGWDRQCDKWGLAPTGFIIRRGARDCQPIHNLDYRSSNRSLSSSESGRWPFCCGQTCPSGSIGWPHIGHSGRPAATIVAASALSSAL